MANNNIIINVLATDPDEATSFYRVWGPLKQLRINANIRLFSEPNINWRTMSYCDVIFMHNPFSANHVAIMEMAISQKVPVWVDYDDNMYELPQWHYSYTKLNAANHKANILKVINNCNVITVSTNTLMNKLIALTNKPIVVIENYLPFPYEPWKLQLQQPEPVFKIMWRGGKAHHIDVAKYLPVITQFVEAHSGKIEFHCMGEPSSLFTLPQITNHADVRIYPIMEITEYYKFLQSHPAHIGIVPIYDTDFSTCMSNNAWKEFLHGGMLSVCPDWFYPGLPFNYTNELDFAVKLDKIYDFYYNDKTQFHNQIIIERAIVENRKSAAIETRIEVFNRLLNKGKKIFSNIFN